MRVLSSVSCSAILASFLVSAVLLEPTQAQTVGTTSPIGISTIPLPAQSDTRVSIPFLRPARYDGSVQALSGNVLTVTGSPGWTAGQFVPNGTAQHDTFFVLLGANAGAGAPKEGCFYTVVDNGTNTLTLDLNGDDASAVQPGTRVTLVPYWTLGTAFPASDAGRSFVASASPSERGMLLIPTDVETVTNIGGVTGGGTKPPAPVGYYFYAGAWRSTQDDSTVSHDDDVLYPDGHLIVRNTATTALTFRPAGGVLLGKFTVPVPTAQTEESSALNVPVGLPRPVDMSLNSLGLVASGIVQDSSEDTVKVFSLGTTGYNQSAAAEYFLSGGAWRKVRAPATQDFGTVLVPAGTGWIIHKVSGDGSTQFWQNSSSYSAGGN